jgi:uncharacterized membrane protein YedE/YeeE
MKEIIQFIPAIALVLFMVLGVIYYFLRRVIYKRTIIRFDTSTESYTEVYEKGKLIATFDHKMNRTH